MSEPSPAVAVVVSTHNRAARLELLLAALRNQELDRDRFEVVVVDDGSTDDTSRVLADETRRGELRLRTIACSRPTGPAGARDRGWRAAVAPLIAFTDDDCEPTPGWLGAGLGASRSMPGCFVQGRTEANPAERARSSPFTRSIEVASLDPNYHTCNIFYPRELLERIDGFDVDSFGRAPGGEDSDLAWRAIAAGGRPVFSRHALVYHAVNELGPLGKLRVAGRWTTPMKAYAVHRELRRATFVHGLFWKRDHYLFARAVLAALLPRRLAPMRAWLAYPYARSVWGRGRVFGGGPLLAPYYVLHDLIEVVAVLRAAIRYRTPMI